MGQNRLWTGCATLLLVIMSAAGCSQPAPAIRHGNKHPLIGTSAAEAKAIEAVYAERLRLGMGGPFRLVEMVMRDERLGDGRDAMAEAMLRSVREGEHYQVSPLVLVAAGADTVSAIAQLDLIEESIDRASDPRIGEHAVALAYEKAVQDSVVTAYVARRAIQVAALLRDRRLAMTDLRRLSRAADHLAVPVSALLLEWRRTRQFRVEQPLITELSAGARADAAHLAMLLTGGVRVAATPIASEMRRMLAAPKDTLSSYDGRVVDDLSRARPQLPQNALAITMRSVLASVRDTHTRAAAPFWQQFMREPMSEEAFAARLGLTKHAPSDDMVAASLALDAAIALRPFAQERVWRAESVTIATIREQYGVRVRVASTVPKTWREPALASLGDALADLKVVAPNINLVGLSIEVAPFRDDANHLAYHDPAGRAIRLDPAAAAGTLAHEIAHDLDWQLARAKYQAKANYATDYAVRNGKAFAYVVEGMQSPNASMMQERPAEAFAVRFEWYVAMALAAEGRMSGYLSSLQTGRIRGYGSAIRPDVGGVGAASFLSILALATGMDQRQIVVARHALATTAASATDCVETSPFQVYSPFTRQATNSRPRPMIHDQVAIGSPTLATPKCAANAIAYRTSDISHTAMVGALPEFFIRSAFRGSSK